MNAGPGTVQQPYPASFLPAQTDEDRTRRISSQWLGDLNEVTHVQQNAWHAVKAQ